jgi:hypothetical protein
MGLSEEKALLELMQMEFNIKKLEVRLLELDEEKIKLNESITLQKQRLVEIKGGNE